MTRPGSRPAARERVTAPAAAGAVEPRLLTSAGFEAASYIEDIADGKQHLSGPQAVGESGPGHFGPGHLEGRPAVGNPDQVEISNRNRVTAPGSASRCVVVLTDQDLPMEPALGHLGVLPNCLSWFEIVRHCEFL